MCWTHLWERFQALGGDTYHTSNARNQKRRMSSLMFDPHTHVPKILNQQFRPSNICNTLQIVCQMHLLVTKSYSRLMCQKEWRYLTKPLISRIWTRGGEVWPHGETAFCKHSWIRGRNPPSQYMHINIKLIDTMDIYYPKPMDVQHSKTQHNVHKFRRWVIGTP